MTPVFFAKQSAFRKWLKQNHKKKAELPVGFYKVHSNKPSMTWPQSVDEALSFGWIDGVRKSIDQESYTIRFTPRKSTSIWSAVNIKKANELIEKGLMEPAGLESFTRRTEERSRVYSFENKKKDLPPALEKQLKANKNAWNFFTAQAPSYQKTIIHWIINGKREPTQQNRVKQLIAESEKQQRIK
ncbi:MAG: YdeI/OmpD-associated family protein [Ferruginibacter sp.]